MPRGFTIAPSAYGPEGTRAIVNMPVESDVVWNCRDDPGVTDIIWMFAPAMGCRFEPFRTSPRMRDARTGATLISMDRTSAPGGKSIGVAAFSSAVPG